MVPDFIQGLLGAMMTSSLTTHVPRVRRISPIRADTSVVLPDAIPPTMPIMAPFSTVIEMLRRVKSGSGVDGKTGGGGCPREAAIAFREGDRISVVGEGVHKPLRLPLFLTLNQQFFRKTATLGGTTQPW